jgi:ubiquinone biosynthesis accessory factor UbiJ
MSLDKSENSAEKSQELSFISKIITNNINRLIKLDSEHNDLIKKLDHKKLWIYIEDINILANLYLDQKQKQLICECFKYKQDKFDHNNFIADDNKKQELLIYGKIKHFIELARTKNPQSLFKDDKLNYEGTFSILLSYHKFYNQLDIDSENLFSYLFGDHLGGFIGKKSKGFIEKAKHSCDKNKEKIIDYLEREKRIIAPKEEIEDWIDDISKLQKDVDRLSAKINKFNKN